MLIGIDASRAVAARPTGTEIYSQQLIRALLALESPHRFRLYFRDPPAPGTFPRAEIRTIPSPRLWTHMRLSWEMSRRPPDALFVPAHVLPATRPATSLVTVHDLGYLAFPEAHPWRQRTYLDLSTRWNVRAATHILADSVATKNDLIARYGTSPRKISVVYPGYDQALAPVGDVAATREALDRHGITGDYFLYLGTLQPRKNLTRLIRALARLPVASPDQQQPQLVVAGRRGRLYPKLVAQARRLDLEERVCFPGYIPNDDKAALFSAALAFVFPSLYEGFGLPVLESQACGCPVITSTTSSLSEVAGEGALLVDPEDTSAIASAMHRVATDPDLRQALVERGYRNVRAFSWSRCAETALNTIERSAAEQRLRRR